MSRIAAPLIAAIGAQILPLAAVDAQLGLYTLPRQDFVWNWGTNREGQRRGAPDIQINGSESFFRCDLTAQIRISSQLSTTQIREIENELSSRLDFIYAASEAMNYLEYSRDLDWAQLDCKKYEPGPSSPEEKAERETEAREKMLRELERRRARQQRDE
jgi:hypothetical protein